MKYIVNFTKKGRMIYISHLDLQRMLLRVLRMTGLKPAYTQGFHPHAKMSIALPLSLGYASEDEFFEFESEEAIDTDVSIIRLNEALPDGICIREIACKPERMKASLAALAAGATYEIMILHKAMDGSTLCEKSVIAEANRWFGQEKIEIEKFNKKKQRAEIIDMRNMVQSFLPLKIWGNKIIFELKLHAENGNMPNPLVLFANFLDFWEMGTVPDIMSVTRTKIMFSGV